MIQGTLFTKGNLKITVSQILRTETPGDASVTHMLTNSHLVELSTMAPAGDLPTAKAIRDFADQLKP